MSRTGFEPVSGRPRVHHVGLCHLGEEGHEEDRMEGSSEFRTIVWKVGY